MTQIIIAIIGSGALSAIISAVVSAINERNQSKIIDRLLLLDALKRQSAEAIARGSITLKDLECIELYYDQYKKRDGDGFADNLMHRVRKLEIVEVYE